MERRHDVAHSGNGTTSKIVAGTALAAAGMATPSFSFLYRNAATPGSAVIDCPFALQDATNAYQLNFTWDNTTAGGVKAVNAKEAAGGTVRRAQMTSSPSANTWYQVGGYYDATNVGVVFEGVVETTTACTALSAAADPIPSALVDVAGTGANFDDGLICEIAVWNVVLNAGEWLALGRRVSPLLIRPSALVLYWPLIRDVYQLIGPAPTATATTVVDHPHVIYAGREPSIGWYDDVFDTSPVSGTVEDTITLGEASDDTTAFDTIEVDDEFTTDGQYGDTSDTLILSEAYESNSGYLANGRMLDRIRK